MRRRVESKLTRTGSCSAAAGRPVPMATVLLPGWQNLVVDVEPELPHDHGDPRDALTAEPPQFGEATSSVLTPMGEVESMGSFARGVGPGRLKLAIFAIGGLVMVLALLAALQG